MNSKAIDKIFTQVLTEKLSTGKYIIASEPMKGHQGEVAKVCLQDVETKKFYVLYLMNEDGRLWGLKDEGYRKPENWDRRELIWAEAEDGYRENDTLWLDRCKKIEVKQFFKIGGRYSSDWFGTLDDAITAKELHRQRYKNGTCEKDYYRHDLKDNVKAYKWALKRVEREHGFKTCSREIQKLELVQSVYKGQVDAYYAMVGVKRTNGKGEVTEKDFRYNISFKRH
jgi:hypothetical protein